jgi:hypothetical protein
MQTVSGLFSFSYFIQIQKILKKKFKAICICWKSFAGNHLFELFLFVCIISDPKNQNTNADDKIASTENHFFEVTLLVRVILETKPK